jgi:two-component system, OmpR family, sensor kinase
MTYRNKLIFTISAVFVIFALITVNLGLVSEDSYRRAIIKSRLESYADMVAKSDSVSVVMRYLPEDLRITIIDSEGNVTMDSSQPAPGMENHLERPEVKDCIRHGSGSSIRKSSTSSEKYFYFAKDYDGRIIRVAQLFEVNLSKFFRTDWMLILSIFFLLVLALVSLIYLSDRYERKESELADRETRRLKHEMTGNISHELKTPVASIQAYLETIVNHPELSEEKRSLFIERSYLQSLRLSDMITDISLITKLEEVPDQFKISPVNVRTVLLEVADEMSQTLESHRITVDNQLPPVCVRANYQLVYAIFRNLVENTLKYAGDGSVASATCTVAEGEYRFDYHDNGVGVEPEQLDKIFERFFRLDADRAKPVGGSGLGLSIVRNAVLFHHGSIHAYCVDGGGLGFSFTLKDLK